MKTNKDSNLDEFKSPNMTIGVAKVHYSPVNLSLHPPSLRYLKQGITQLRVLIVFSILLTKIRAVWNNPEEKRISRRKILESSHTENKK